MLNYSPTHDYDSFPEKSYSISPSIPNKFPNLQRTGFSDYGNVLSNMKMYQIDIPSYQQFKKIKKKGEKEKIYNKLLIYWNNGHSSIAGNTRKRKSKRKNNKSIKRRHFKATSARARGVPALIY